MTGATAGATPRQMRLLAGGTGLEVDFAAPGPVLGPVFGPVLLSAEFLRAHSPSAEVQGHAPGERRLVTGKRAVRILGLDPVGRYAVRLRFDDGHDTGLFSWDTLLRLCRDRESLWASYLAELAEQGQSRDAPTS